MPLGLPGFGVPCADGKSSKANPVELRAGVWAFTFAQRLERDSEDVKTQSEALTNALAAQKTAKNHWSAARGKLAALSALKKGTADDEVGEDGAGEDGDKDVRNKLKAAHAAFAAAAPLKARHKKAALTARSAGLAVTFLQKLKADNVAVDDDAEAKKLESAVQKEVAEAQSEVKAAAGSKAKVSAAKAKWEKLSGALKFVSLSKSAAVQADKADLEKQEAAAKAELQSCEAEDSKADAARVKLAGAAAKLRALRALQGGIKEEGRQKALSALITKTQEEASTAEDEAEEVEEGALQATSAAKKLNAGLGALMFIQKAKRAAGKTESQSEVADAAEDEETEAEAEALVLKAAAEQAKATKSKWLTAKAAISAAAAFNAAVDPSAAAKQSKQEALQEEASAKAELEGAGSVADDVAEKTSHWMQLKGALAFVSKAGASGSDQAKAKLEKQIAAAEAEKVAAEAISESKQSAREKLLAAQGKLKAIRAFEKAGKANAQTQPTSGGFKDAASRVMSLSMVVGALQAEADEAEQEADEAQEEANGAAAAQERWQVAVGAARAAAKFKLKSTSNGKASALAMMQKQCKAAANESTVASIKAQVDTAKREQTKMSLWGVVGAKRVASSLKAMIPGEETDNDDSEDDDEDITECNGGTQLDKTGPKGWATLRRTVQSIGAFQAEVEEAEREVKQIDDGNISDDDSDSDDDTDDDTPSGMGTSVKLKLSAVSAFKAAGAKSAAERAKQARKKWGAAVGAVKFANAVKARIEDPDDSDADDDAFGGGVTVSKMLVLKEREMKAKAALEAAEAEEKAAITARRKLASAKAKLMALNAFKTEVEIIDNKASDESDKWALLRNALAVTNADLDQKKVKLHAAVKEAKEEEEEGKQAVTKAASAASAVIFAKRLQMKAQRKGTIAKAELAEDQAKEQGAEEAEVCEQASQENSEAVAQQAAAQSKWNRLQGSMRAVRAFGAALGAQADAKAIDEIHEKADKDLQEASKALAEAGDEGDAEEAAEAAERRFKKATNAIKFLNTMKPSGAKALSGTFKKEANEAKSHWKSAQMKLAAVRALKVKKQNAAGARWAAAQVKLQAVVALHSESSSTPGAPTAMKSALQPVTSGNTSALRSAALAVKFANSMEAKAADSKATADKFAGAIAAQKTAKNHWSAARGKLAALSALKKGTADDEVGEDGAGEDGDKDVRNKLKAAHAAFAAAAPLKARHKKAALTARSAGLAVTFLQKLKADNVAVDDDAEAKKLESAVQKEVAEAQSEVKAAAGSKAKVSAAKAKWEKLSGALKFVSLSKSAAVQADKADLEKQEAAAKAELQSCEAEDSKADAARVKLAGAAAKLRALRALQGGIKEEGRQKALSALITKTQEEASTAEDEAEEVEEGALQATSAAKKLNAGLGALMFIQKAKRAAGKTESQSEVADAAEDEETEAEAEALVLKAAAEQAKATKSKWLTAKAAISAAAAFNAAVDPSAAAKQSKQEALQEEASAKAELEGAGSVADDVAEKTSHWMQLKGALAFVSKAGASGSDQAKAKLEKQIAAAEAEKVAAEAISESKQSAREKLLAAQGKLKAIRAFEKAGKANAQTQPTSGGFKDAASRVMSLSMVVGALQAEADEAEQEADEAQEEANGAAAAQERWQVAVGAARAAAKFKLKSTSNGKASALAMMQKQCKAAANESTVASIKAQVDTAKREQTKMSLWGVVGAKRVASSLKAMIPGEETDNDDSEDDDEDITECNGGTQLDKTGPKGWATLRRTVQSIGAFQAEVEEAEREVKQIDDGNISDDDSDSDDDTDDDTPSGMGTSVKLKLSAVSAFKAAGAKSAAERAKQARKKWGAAVGAVKFANAVKARIEDPDDSDADDDAFGGGVTVSKMLVLKEREMKAKAALEAAEAEEKAAITARRKLASAKAKLMALNAFKTEVEIIDNKASDESDKWALLRNALAVTNADLDQKKVKLHAAVKEAKEEEEEGKQAVTKAASAASAVIFAKRLQMKAQRKGTIAKAELAEDQAKEQGAEEAEVCEQASQENSEAVAQQAAAQSKWNRLQGSMRAVRAFAALGAQADAKAIDEIHEKADKDLQEASKALAEAGDEGDAEEAAEAAERRFKKATNAIKFLNTMKPSGAKALSGTFKKEANEAKSHWKSAQMKLAAVRALKVKKQNAAGARWATAKLRLGTVAAFQASDTVTPVLEQP